MKAYKNIALLLSILFYQNINGQTSDSQRHEYIDSQRTLDSVISKYYTLSDCDKIIYFDTVMHKYIPMINSSFTSKIIRDLEIITKKKARRSQNNQSFVLIIYDRPRDLDSDIHDWAKILGCDTSVLHYYNKEYTDTLHLLNKKILEEPNNYQLYIKRAEIEIQLDDYNAAIENYEMAIKLDSLNPIIYYKRGQLWKKCRVKDQACIDFERAKELGMGLTDELKKYCSTP